MANPTTNLNIELPVSGSSKGTWGTILNDAIQSLDTGVTERGVPAGGSDNQVLTKNGADDYETQWVSTITGDVTGNLTGDVTGNLTGNVTGNLTGNADTVTTNATLTGDVTSSGNATTIAESVVNESKLQVSNTPTDGHVLTAQSGNTGGMTWQVPGTGAFEELGTGVAMAVALGLVLTPLLG
jgi:hypothetical protein